MRSITMRINEQGRSMIEMLGVLAIVGVLSVGGIAGYSKAMNKFKTNKVIDQVNMLSTNIRTLYSSQRSYAGLNNTTAVDASLVPAEMYDPNGRPTGSNVWEITNGFANAVSILPAKQTRDGDSFVLTFYGIPQSSCVTIATTEWGSDVGSGLVAIAIQEDSPAGTTGDTSYSTTIAGFNEPVTEGSGTTSEEEGTPSETGEGLIAIVGSDTNGLPVSVPRALAACSSSNVIAWKYL